MILSTAVLLPGPAPRVSPLRTTLGDSETLKTARHVHRTLAKIPLAERLFSEAEGTVMGRGIGYGPWDGLGPTPSPTYRGPHSAPSLGSTCYSPNCQDKMSSIPPDSDTNGMWYSKGIQGPVHLPDGWQVTKIPSQILRLTNFRWNSSWGSSSTRAHVGWRTTTPKGSFIRPL